jgi:hypothetical protein
MGSLDVQELVLPDEALDPRPALADHDLTNTGAWAAPAEADAQEVVFSPPVDEEHGASTSDEPLLLVFDMKAEDIDDRIAEVCESAYIYYGEDGLKELGAAFIGTGVESAPFAMLLPVPARGERIYIDPERTPKRHRLRAAYDSYREALPDRRTRSESVIEATSLPLALRRLEASREQVATETMRYLSLAEDRRAAALEFLRRGFTQSWVTGPEALGLAADLRAIAQARRTLAERVGRQRAEVDRWDQARRPAIDAYLQRPEVRQGRLSEREIIGAIQAMGLLGDPEAVRAARAAVGQQQRLVAELVAQRAARRPILFRLWNGEVPFEVDRALAEVEPTATTVEPYLCRAALPATARRGYRCPDGHLAGGRGAARQAHQRPIGHVAVPCGDRRCPRRAAPGREQLRLARRRGPHRRRDAGHRP